MAPLTSAAGTEIPAYLGPTAVLIVAAAAVGYLCVRLRVVPIVGFLLAGVLIGPAQLGLVSSTSSVDAAAEVGVMLLLFTSGSSSHWTGLPRCGAGSWPEAAHRWR